MSKYAPVISSSPRKGSKSELLCDRFIAGPEQAGHRAEKVRLSDCKIGYCVACEAYRKNGGKCW